MQRRAFLYGFLATSAISSGGAAPAAALSKAVIVPVVDDMPGELRFMVVPQWFFDLYIDRRVKW